MPIHEYRTSSKILFIVKHQTKSNNNSPKISLTQLNKKSCHKWLPNKSLEIRILKNFSSRKNFQANITIFVRHETASKNSKKIRVQRIDPRISLIPSETKPNRKPPPCRIWRREFFRRKNFQGKSLSLHLHFHPVIVICSIVTRPPSVGTSGK